MKLVSLKNPRQLLYIPVVALMMLFVGTTQGQILYTNPSNALWLTPANWTGSVVPTSTDVSQIGANPTGSGGVGIDMSGATNNGSNNQAVGAIEMTSARTSGNVPIGNSSTVSSGTLTLSGATVNAIPNAIIRNYSSKDLTISNIQGTGTMTMNIVMTNTVDNKILQDGSGKIIISAPINGVNCPLTVQGAGTSEVDITNANNTYSGPISLFGSETVFSTEGSFGAVPGSLIPNAITIDGGRMTCNSTYTLNSNRGIKVGQTPGTSISVKTSTTTLTYNGVIADLTTNGSWAKQGGNVLQLGGVNIYTGATGISNGAIKLINGNNRLPITTTLNIGQAASTNVGAFDLNGFNQQVAGLNSIAGTNTLTTAKNTITTTSTPATLTLNGAGTYSYGFGTLVNSGIISGSVSLVKSGTGLQILSDVNTYIGSTTINSGELRFSPIANESLNSPVTLNGGTLGTAGIISGRALTFSTLNVTDNSQITLEATNTHTLNFAASNGIIWITAKTLTITGWQGNYSAGTSGTAGQIFVGSNASGLTASQLAGILFFNGTNYYPAMLLSTGELVPFCVTPNISSISSNTVLCAGGVINLSVTATGTMTPTFLWFGPNSFTSSAQNVSVAATGTLVSGIYTLTATNACGTASATTAVTVNALPNVIANTSSSVICTSQSVTLSGSGANTYSWTSGISNGVSFSPTVTTIYTVTGTDINTCVNSATVSITVNITPTLSVNAATICIGTSVTLTASGATTYTWNTSSNSTSIVVAPTANTTYTISGSNPGCSSSLTTAVTVYSLPILFVNNATVCAGTTVSLGASGATTYTWSTGSNSSSITVAPATTSVYTISGTSTQSCVSSATTQITINALPTITSFSTSVCAGGTATLTVGGADTYTWSDGTTGTVIVTSPTADVVYTITGTSIDGCVNTGTTGITVTSSPSITVNSQTICTGNSATLIATGVSTFTWGTGENTATLVVTPISTSVYSVSGNTSGCGALTASNTVTVSVNPLPTVTVNSATICAGTNATLIASGADTYLWGNGSTSASVTPSPTSIQIYTVTGTSTLGCSSTTTAQVDVNSTPTLSINSATICAGDMATLTVSGANTYTWNMNSNTTSISVSPLFTTDYTVMGTSTLGCVGSVTTEVLVNAIPTLSVNSQAICTGATATLTASGASSYSWSTNITTNFITVSPITTTDYTLTGTDAGCTGSVIATVTVNALPVVSVNNASICSGGAATLTASGAATYTLNTGSINSTFTVNPSANTDYTVTGTSSVGCVTSTTAMVSISSNPTITASSATICAGSTATLTGTGATTYSWNTGNSNGTFTVAPSSTSIYTLTGTTSGCSGTMTSTVTVNALPVVSLSVNHNTLCASDNSLALSGTPSGGAYSGTGVTGNAFSPSVAGAGVYTLTYFYTDVNNCSNADHKTITVGICTGIKENSSSSVVHISPNPAQNEITINNESFEGNYSIGIYEGTGELVYSSSADQASITINLNNFTNGVYVLRITENQKQTNLKFIKN